MKRIWIKLFAILAVSFALLLQNTSKADAATVIDPSTKLVFDDSTGTITGYIGNDNELTIPSAMNGVAVTAIGPNAFDGVYSLRNVTIPDSVTSIASKAFYYCFIETLTMSKNIKSIGSMAFYGNEIDNVLLPSTSVIVSSDSFSDTTTVYYGDQTYKPIINTNPLDASYTQGKTVLPLYVDATVAGIGVLSYQWYSNTTNSTNGGNAIIGANMPSYTPALGKVGTKYYYCVVTTTNGKSIASKTANRTSQVATITTNPYLDSSTSLLIDLVTGTITGYTGDDVNVDIPSTINGVIVTAIGPNAFDEIYRLKSVTIPDSITSIASKAFYYSNISSLKMSKSIKTIGDYAFYGNNISSVLLPNSSVSLGNDAFDKKTAIYYEDQTYTPYINVNPVSATYRQGKAVQALKVSASVRGIGTLSYQWYFNNTNSTTGGIAITGAKGNSYTPVLGGVGTSYYYCVVTSTNSKSIGRKTANQATSIASITVTPYIDTATSFVFDLHTGTILGYSGSDSTLSIPISINGVNVTSISQYAFENKTFLKEVIIPDTVTSIGKGAFNGCFNLSKVTMSKNVKVIGDYAFYESENLSSIILPSSSVTVGKNTFNHLTRINYSSMRKVTFDSNGGSSVKSQTVELTKLVSVPVSPTKAGYSFDGWYNGTTLYDFKTPLKGNLTLTAKWKALPNYTIVYNTNGGTSVKSSTTYSGNRVNTPKNPTKKGYVFAGWYTSASGGTKVTFPITMRANLTVYAKWTTFATIVPSKVQAIGGSKKVSIYWDSVSSANKYQVWYSSSKSGKYKLLATVTATSYTHKGLGVKKSYYYKIRAYQNSGKLYSKYSSIAKGTTLPPSAPSAIVNSPSGTSSNCKSFMIYVQNTGNRPIRIYNTNSKMVDDDFSSYNRSLQLVDNKSGKSLNWVEIPAHSSVYISFKVKGASTWYDPYTTISFEFTYDGVRYVSSISNYYGNYYKVK